MNVKLIAIDLSEFILREFLDMLRINNREHFQRKIETYCKVGEKNLVFIQD